MRRRIQVTISEARETERVKHWAEVAHHHLGYFLPHSYHLLAMITIRYEVIVRGHVVKYWEGVRREGTDSA